MAVPKHIAIILDGNRRYEKKHKLAPGMGHRKGAENAQKMVEWCLEKKVKELTLYTFSQDNFKRTMTEKKTLFSLFSEGLKEAYKDNYFEKKGIRVRFVGRISSFPGPIAKKMNELMKHTAHNKKLTVNFAMAYSAKAEIVNAVKEIGAKIKKGKYRADKITEKTIEKHLYNASQPDMFIRPGGEKRLSDFLLWQSAYSELFFVDKLWPEVTKADFGKLLKQFSDRNRRFGK